MFPCISGVGLSFNYPDLLVGVAVFTAVLLTLAIGLMWLVMRTYIKKVNSRGQNVASPKSLPIAPVFDLKNVCKTLPLTPTSLSYMPGFQMALKARRFFRAGNCRCGRCNQRDSEDR